MVDIGIGTHLAAARRDIDKRELNLAHARMVIDDALAHAKRALTAADAIDAPLQTRDSIFIAITRLAAAKAACKE